MQRRPLGQTGIEVSRLGFGAASLGEEYGPIDLSTALDAVPAALDAGITFLDTSPYYGRGRSEVLLGFALRGIPRDRYTLCTKLGRYGAERFDFSPGRIRESVETSLDRLGTDHLDVVLCHDVEFVDRAAIVDTAMPTLHQLKAEGLVRAVGCSAYPPAALRFVVEQGAVDVILSYANLTLHNQRLRPLLDDCVARGVGVIDAAPFDMRLLTDTEPPPWHPAPAELRDAVAKARVRCAEHGTTLARLAFQAALAEPDVATTVVGTAHVAEIREWIDWLDAPFDDRLAAELRRMLAATAGPARIVGRPENN